MKRLAEQSAGRMAGTVALVTGGWRGIGAAACTSYAANGAAVAINYPPGQDAARQGAERLADKIIASGARAICVEADVSKRDNVFDMVAGTEVELGSVGVLVANAAATGRLGFMDIDQAEW